MRNLDDHTYVRFCSKQNLNKSLNTLRGILAGMNLDGAVTGVETNELISWCREHENLTKANPFNELIPLIEEASKDGIIDQDEIEDINWCIDAALSENSYYDHITESLQVLNGIMHGVLADGEVSDEEIREVSNWLDEHDYLQGAYPYDELNSLLTEVLKDQKISDAERVLLKAFFSEFANLSSEGQSKQLQRPASIHGLCAVTPEIVFEDRLFCFTGMSVRAKRNDMVDMVERFGGQFTRSPNKKLNYLIYGAAGNQCWAFSCHGRKVEQVMKMRKQGLPVVIVHENDFWDAYEDFR